jgi:hypothetical protein
MITLVDTPLSGRTNIRTGGQVVFYWTDARRMSAVANDRFQNFNNFLLGLATNSSNSEGITTRFKG